MRGSDRTPALHIPHPATGGGNFTVFFCNLQNNTSVIGEPELSPTYFTIRECDILSNQDRDDYFEMIIAQLVDWIPFSCIKHV